MCRDARQAAMKRFQTGFTLVEAVMVITITGIIATVVATFIRAPIQGYFDAARRAELTDVADTSIRRIARDLRLALPNSVRLTGGNQVIEFLQVRTGGRYRAELGAVGDDILDFSLADTSFNILGPVVTFVAGDQLVVYNLGIPGADAYAGNNISAITGIAGNNVTINAKQFPFASPGNRFQIVDTPVTYVCDSAARTLTRYWGYPITVAQSNPPAGGNNALLATSVTCNFSYAPGVTARSGLVSMQLATALGGESVNLYHEVHVSNVP